MYKTKRLIAFIMILCLLFSLQVTSFTSKDTNTAANKVYLENFTINDIEKHKDVQEYVNSKELSKVVHDFIDYVKDRSAKATSSSGKLTDIMSQSEIDRITKKYNLEKPEDPNQEPDINVLVKRNTKTVGSQTVSSIVNVWYLIYWVTGQGFEIVVWNLGTDLLDSITGTVERYSRNGHNWEHKELRHVNQGNVSSGNIYTWGAGKGVGAEKFTYTLTVTEDGVSWQYQNQVD